MAKNTNFQNWQSDSINRDRCPVCWDQMGYRSRSNYCSDRCVEVGKTIRNRIRASAVRFQIVGFILTFQDGVYPELKLPYFMGKYYPEPKATIYPLEPRKLDSTSCVVSEFWDGMVRNLGHSVCDKIATVNMKKSENIVAFRAEFDQILSDLMFLQEGVFICPDCGAKHFDGELTRGKFGKTCCELKQPELMRYPF